MGKKRVLAILLSACLGALTSGQASTAPVVTEFFGACDASAAAALDETLFVAASDEDNALRIYRKNKSGSPVSTLDLTSFLKTDSNDPEADIEAAARIGDRIFWISSHGTNGKGEYSPNRRRFFATKLNWLDGSVNLVPEGVPYDKLVNDITNLPDLKNENIGKAAKIAPKQPGGLNIEGLSATPGGALLIGLRNPVPDGKALLIPLENPLDVIAGKSAILGSPIRLALGGRGVRSIEYVPALNSYLIIAGLPGVGGKFELYRWSGSPSEEAKLVRGVKFDGFQPEGMIVYPGDESKAQIFSDDGTKKFAGKFCKKLPVAKRHFRSVWVEL